MKAKFSTLFSLKPVDKVLFWQKSPFPHRFGNTKKLFEFFNFYGELESAIAKSENSF